MPWQTATNVLIPSLSPVEFPAVFLNTATGVFQLCGQPAGAIPTPNAWHDLDLKSIGVPATALAVDIRGFLIITSGTGTSIADLAVAFRSPASGASVYTPGSYVNQTISVLPTGGSRTNGTAIAPCVNGVTQWAWLRGDNGKGEWPDQPIPPYPTGASYGLNLSVAQIFMP
ncbi:hypothetical protein [uncultured Bradyrhizobium sp.]|uniref:hypothetical protein n=1 Tax=Bradyrhizobium sp. TaxID=376 RepID=UPI002610ADEC|nr:hypothetical protein [uncultured Bradyrhizobium sp.]